jgi:hypothetical protein
MLIGARRALLRRPKVTSASYTAYGVRFDGTNDYLTRGAGLSGAVDGYKGICSFWVRFTGGDSNFHIIFENNDQWGLQRYNNGILAISMKDSGGTGMFGVDSTTTFLSGGSWAHILYGWDGTAATAATSGLWVNDVNEGTPNFNGSSSVLIDYTKTNWGFGHRLTGSLLCDFEIADFYFNSAEHLDFTNSANRRKFITAGLRPVDLGANGSTPTGTQPIVFFKGSSGVPSDFGTNLGSGGSFTTTGTLTAAASNP